MKAQLFIVDDDANTLASLSRAFRLAGHEATVCDNPIKALEMIKAEKYDVIFSDVVMPAMNGLALLEQIKAAGVTTPVVMMSGQAHIEMAVKATRLGALDFLEKPISTDKLLLTVQNALQLERLKQENQQLRQQLGSGGIVFTGEKMRKLMAQVERVAASETRVCILGETGTGKELIARTIHDKSPRHAGPYVTLNCAAVPAELIESELFGHEKGSFTGAASRHIGKFEQATDGTLFLDEIGDMPLAMQAKLLRVLEQGEVERIGGDKPTKVNVRVVVATHRQLEEQVKQGNFRQDLFHRIFVFPIVLPPLRERPEDIPALAAHFAAQIVKQNNWKEITFSPGSIAGFAGAFMAGKHPRAAQRGGAPAAVCRRRYRNACNSAGRAAIAGRRWWKRGLFRNRHAGRARGASGAADDPGRDQAPQPEHHQHGKSAGAGAQPSL